MLRHKLGTVWYLWYRDVMSLLPSDVSKFPVKLMCYSQKRIRVGDSRWVTDPNTNSPLQNSHFSHNLVGDSIRVTDATTFGSRQILSVTRWKTIDQKLCVIFTRWPKVLKRKNSWTCCLSFILHTQKSLLNLHYKLTLFLSNIHWQISYCLCSTVIKLC